jgi:hypothetical protein
MCLGVAGRSLRAWAARRSWLRLEEVGAWTLACKCSPRRPAPLSPQVVVTPRGGQLVIFDSKRIWHEVRPDCMLITS